MRKPVAVGLVLTGVAAALIWVGSLAPSGITQSLDGVAMSLNVTSKSRPLLTMTARNGGRIAVRLDSNTRVMKTDKVVAASHIRTGDKLRVDYVWKWGTRIARRITIESPPPTKKPSSQPIKKRR